MPRAYDLKIWPTHFWDIRSGAKRYEVRKNDRTFLVGDEILLREWDPEPAAYTGRVCLVRIIHVTDSTSWEFIPNWITIFGFETMRTDGPTAL